MTQAKQAAQTLAIANVEAALRNRRLADRRQVAIVAGTYRYSSYWRTWSRVLLLDFKGLHVELDLTGVNQTWGDPESENIRVHSTAFDAKDLLVSHLPTDVLADMTKAMGADKVRHLLTFDYLARVDWVLYAKHNNGGASFAEICR